MSLAFRLVMLALILGGSGMQAATAEQATAPETILALSGAGQFTLSPDGRHVARLPVVASPELQIFQSDDLRQPSRIVPLPARVVGMNWSQDGRLLFLRTDEAAGERTLRLPIAGGIAADLAPSLPGRVRLVSGTPSAGGSWLVMHTPRRGAPVRLVELAPGGQAPRDVTPVGNYGWFAADDQGRPAMGLRIGADGTLAWIRLNADGSPGPVIIEAGAAGTNEPVTFARTAEGRRLVIFRTADDDGFPRLTAHDLDGGPARVILSPGHDITSPVFARQEARVIAYTSESLLPKLVILNPEDRAAFAGLEGNAGFTEVVSQARNGVWLVKRRYADRPAAFFLYHAETGTLSSPLVEMPGAPMPAVTRAAWVKARDGLPLSVYLAVPSDAIKAPLLVLVHGGPWGRDRFDYDRTQHWLVARGFAVLRVNFRGSTGFGQGFTKAGEGQWSGAMLKDVLDATRWALTQPNMDPGPPVYVGGSYGGFAALMLATNPEIPPRCTVAIAAATDLGSFAPKQAAAEKKSKAQLVVALGDFDDPAVRERLTAGSPIARTAEVKAPVLLIHGGKDPRAPLDDVLRYAEALNARDPKLVSLVVAPDEGHSFTDPRAIVAAVRMQERFLSHCLGMSPASADDPGPLRVLLSATGR